MKKVLGALALVAGFSLTAGAHELWMERDGSEAKVYFGHWSHNFKELRSKERLNIIKAETILPKEALKSKEMVEDGIALKLQNKGDVALIETLEPRKGRNVETIMRPTFLARNGRSEAKSLMELDLVPEAPNANSFTLLFRGKPLAKTKVTLYAPHKWSKSYMSDEAGKITIQTPWKGMYLASAHHVDETKGEVNGKAYEKSNYIMTVVFVNEAGIPWEEK